MPQERLLNILVKRADGREATLAEYHGDVILIVNVASKCRLTVQYDGLEKLDEEKRERGFVIAAFPSNDFNGQEPGTDEEIVSFSRSAYDVKFPIFSKISVKGEAKHPLYRQLTGSSVGIIGEGPMRESRKRHGIETIGTEIVWNFEKFLIGRDGEDAAQFAPDVTVEDPRFLSVLETELARNR